MSIKQTINMPLQLEPNRVRRMYRGGKLLNSFQNDHEKNCYMPEDWIGSTTQAKNIDFLEGEGIGEVWLAGDLVSLAIIQKDVSLHTDLYGPGDLSEIDPGILVKLLDASERLSIQSHPDSVFSKKHFAEAKGKCECWIVLDVRKDSTEKPFVYFGFKDSIAKEDFENAYYSQDIQSIEKMLNKIHVQPGDMFFVPPNIIHSIGPGVLILEIQEPTDYVFRYEKEFGGTKLSPNEIHMGLGDKLMLDTLSYGLTGEELLRLHFRQVSFHGKKTKIIQLLKDYELKYFEISLISIWQYENITLDLKSKTKAVNLFPARIGVVIEGKVKITALEGNIEISKGQAYIIPANSIICDYKDLFGKSLIIEANALVN